MKTNFMRSTSYYIYILFLLSYFFIIIYNANLQVIDDHGILNNLMKGESFYGYLSTDLFKIGRFYPLNMQEFNLINYFSTTTSIQKFYLFIAIEFAIFVYLFFKIFNYFKIDNKYIYIFTIFLLLSPGFVTAFFRLHIGERSVLVFFTIFLYFYLKYQKNQNILFMLIGLISANIGLYYKEPAFLMLGSFAFFHLLFAWKEINFKQKLFDFLLMLSSLIFILNYYFIVYINQGDTLYGSTTFNPILVFAKMIFNFLLIDPLLIFLLIPLVAWRGYVILKFRKANSLIDTLLFSSFVYVLVFLELNMFAHHYLLPAYAFGLIAISYYMIHEQLYKKLVFKILLIMTGFTFIFSSLPTGLHLLSHYKNVPHNFQNTLSFLTKYIKDESRKGKRVSIFLDGVNRNGGEVHHSFIKYLEYRGLNYLEFDIKSNESDNGVLPTKKPDKNALYTILKQSDASQVETGDLVIITPYTTKYIGLDKKELSAISQEYELLYHTESFLEIPNIGVKSLIKGFYRKYKNEHNDKVMISENIYDMPLDFYIFRKK